MRVGGWWRLVGLCINGVRLRRKIWWRLVGAVPVCPPVSPCRGASVVHLLRTMHVFFCHGNAAARTCRPTRAHPSFNSPRTMCVFLVWKRRCADVSPCRGASIVRPPRTMRMFLLWKRRCADVRAGTQAPPLRFRLGGLLMVNAFRLGGDVCKCR